MIVSRAVLAPIVILVALFSSMTVLFAGLAQTPDAFLATDDVVFVTPPGDALIGRKSMPETITAAAANLPGVTHVSPEVLVLTTLQGTSLFVRGANFDAFLAFEDARLVEGSPPLAPRQALVGESLAAHLGLRVGDAVLIPSPFSPSALPVRIVGVLAAEGVARDELVVSLPDARALAHVASGEVHLLRLRTSSPDAVRAFTDANAAVFQYGDVRLDVPAAIPGAPATMHANLTNWGGVAGAKVVQVRQGDVVLAERVVPVGAKRTLAIEVPFTLRHAGAGQITINPTFDVDTHEPELQILATPDVPVVGAPLTLQVFGLTGAPVAGATLRLLEQEAVTDQTGQATLTPTSAGPFVVLATHPDGRAGALQLNVAPPPSPARPEGFYPEVVRVRPPAEAVGTHANATFTLIVHNGGTVPGTLALRIRLDNRVIDTPTLDMAPNATIQHALTLPLLEAGIHRITVDDWPLATHDFKVYAGRNPEGERLLDGAWTPPSRTIVPGTTVVGEDVSVASAELLGNIAPALTTLAIATAALTVAAASVVLWRHVTDAARSVGTLKALGAADDQVVDLVGKSAFHWGAAAAILGVAAGLGAARLIAWLGLLRAFGHAVHPYESPRLIAFLVLASLAAVALGARIVTRRLLAVPPDDLLRGRVTRGR